MGADPTFNLADLFEAVADAVPDRTALIAGEARLTYRQLDERAERFAHHLRASGIRPGEFVGIHAWNRAEWIEAMIGAHKARAVPININYRYVTAELRYLYENAEMAALVVERGFVRTVAELAPAFPGLRHIVVLEDGTDPSAHALDRGVRYEDALAAASPARDAGPRSPDDVYGLYTGGTTGMPKCVLWRSEDIFFAALQAGRAGRPRVTSPAELGAEAAASDPLITMGLAPMMHGGGQWSMWNTFYMGNTYILWTGRHFDPDAIMALVAREQALSLAVVGDGMARPLADWYERNPGKYDIGSLKAVSNGGAPMSAAVRRQLETTAGLFVLDSFGASETGAAAREAGAPGGATRFASSATTTVLDADLRPVAPGSGEVGRLAVTGHIPLGYHGDAEKTRATFPVDREGRRWVLPGDFARIEEDGTLTLLGRGSATVNTGGEKVFPDEVEAALKAHPDVFDAVVVGVPDPRLGERVTALVVARDGTTPDPDALGAHARTLVAGYKVPKRIHLVDTIERTAAGKVDLRAAKAHAERLSAGR
ncbi:acyl-CoA synthetase [Yinghuangia sp. ASG 101]|uniref:acyl-CoA synthetase n=1 Tax=Yinghuangia sp. ASG 101 TaxID=2896848 RepID=UPI001E47581B|nr:acyl-CoA synthetase [Yinghuangia sp. ASG 101]UGQ10282.1 acyl-CoA synthetase [Yinghuangia sp. ASG 101]